MDELSRLRQENARLRSDVNRFRRGMFAEAGMRAQLEARRGIAAAVNGNDQGARRSVVANNGVEPYSLNDQMMRLTGFHAQLQNGRNEEAAEDYKNAKEFLDNFAAVNGDLVEGSAAAKQFAAVVGVVKNAKFNSGEIECSICYSAIPQDKMFLGKGCWHPFCSECLLNYARSQAPMMGDFTIWVPNPDGSRDPNPEKLGQFPATGSIKCPGCRGDDFCDKAFFALNAKAREQVLTGASRALLGDQDAAQEIEDQRRKMHLFVLPVGFDGSSKKMIVEAAIPHDKTQKFREFGPASGTFAAYTFGSVLKDDGWSWDADQSETGGRAWYKDDKDVLQPGDEPPAMPEFDQLPAGSVLRQTDKGTWKIDLPYECMTDAGKAAHVARKDWAATVSAEKKARKELQAKAAAMKRERIVVAMEDSSDE